MDWTALQTSLTQEFFGNPLQNYLSAFTIFLAVFTTLPILRALIMRHLTQLSEKTAPGLFHPSLGEPTLSSPQ